MLTKSKIIWFYIAGISFLILNALALYKERFELLIIPPVLYITYLALFKLDKLYYVLIFLIPLSVNLNSLDIGLGVGMALPTEPIIVGIFMLIILKYFSEGGYDRKILKHPITILIGVNLFVVFITSLTSEHPIVSFKFLLSRMWFLAVFYFLSAQIFKQKGSYEKFNWLYIAGFVLIIIYTFWQHSVRGFDQKSANWVMNPFFNDHTSYGACLAFFFPFLIGVTFSKKTEGVKKMLYFLLLALFTVALILSYTRAAWLSLVGAFAVFIVLHFKIKWQFIALSGLVLGSVLILSWNEIMFRLEDNKQDSSSNITEHVSSMSNVSTDASNKERLNRWKSAWNMFLERPIQGWGPGVYAFEYAPFQSSKDKTIISTNSGDMGNAHSEYLGPLSESGIIGFASMVALVVTTIITAVRLFKKNIDSKYKFYITTAFLGLVTYYIHGVLNNFLDTDKASAPFWAFTALIVVVDVYFSSEKTEKHLEDLPNN